MRGKRAGTRKQRSVLVEHLQAHGAVHSHTLVFSNPHHPDHNQYRCMTKRKKNKQNKKKSLITEPVSKHTSQSISSSMFSQGYSVKHRRTWRTWSISVLYSVSTGFVHYKKSDNRLETRPLREISSEKTLKPDEKHV